MFNACVYHSTTPEGKSPCLAGTDKILDACRCPVFDLTMYARNPEEMDDDTALTQEIIMKSSKLGPSEVELGLLKNALGKITAALTKIKNDPKLVTDVIIDDFWEIGSTRKETILAGHKTIDLVVSLKSMPIIESVHALGQKVAELIRAEREQVTVQSKEFGCFFVFAATGIKANLMISTITSNIPKLEDGLHISESVIKRHYSALRRTRWYEDVTRGTPVNDLVKVVKDIRSRVTDLKPLSVWTIEFLCHHCWAVSPTEMPLALGPALRRFFQLLSSGSLLPGSAKLFDPCDPPNDFGSYLSLEEADRVCSAGQMIFIVFARGGYSTILGPEFDPSIGTKRTSFVAGYQKIEMTPVGKGYSEAAMQKTQEMAAQCGDLTEHLRQLRSVCLNLEAQEREIVETTFAGSAVASSDAAKDNSTSEQNSKDKKT